MKKLLLLVSCLVVSLCAINIDALARISRKWFSEDLTNPKKF